MLKTAAGLAPMFSQVVSAQQLANLLLEIAPEENKPAIVQQKPCRFEYTAYSKTVAVAFSMESGQAGARLTLLAAAGKSTTLCALVDYINRHRKDHIITIEDPIEFVHQKKNCLINQREVHVHTKSFSQALRAALREDPDIVLVGEMRDLGTISIAIETAETGHLVFGTLHTTTAASTVDRIIDQFPADRQPQIRTMLSTSLKGVISQTLCKKIGGGRIAAMEALFVTSAVSNLIREGKIYQIPSIMQTGKKQGMTVLNDVLFKQVVDKQVAPEEAYIKSVDKAGFVALLKTKSIVLDLKEIEE